MNEVKKEATGCVPTPCAVCGGDIKRTIVYVSYKGHLLPMCESDALLGVGAEEFSNEEIKELVSMRANPGFTGSATDSVEAWVAKAEGRVN